MDENYNGFNSGDSPNPNPNDTAQFDYTQPAPDTMQTESVQPNYNPYGYGQQSDYNQVYNQPNYNQPNYNQQYYNQQYNYSPNYGGEYQTDGSASNTKAILSLVFGIVSVIVCCTGVNTISGIVGVVMAILSKGENRGKMSGMAIAGMILSIIGFALSLLIIIAAIIAISSDPTILEGFY